MPNLRELPKGIRTNQEMIQEALALGCLQAKVIPAKTISLAHWLKAQCQFGCPHFGTRLTCPPFTPVPEEVSDLLREYERAILIKTSDCKQVREIVVQLEGSLKTKGYYKAFGLCATACDLCEECTIETSCKFPTQARPTLRAFGVDISKTIFNNGWVSDVAMDYCTTTHPIGLVLMD